MDRTKANDANHAGDGDRIVAEELERLLASPLFARSPVLSRLLQFLVEHRLRGGRSAPKAYAIATEALGRSADFDPAIDSYPRVMIGRLRGLLDRYYADIPWTHRLRVPQGSYEIVVQHRAPPPSRGLDPEGGPDLAPAAASAPRPAATRRRPPAWLWGAVALLLLAVVTAWWLLAGRDELAAAPVPTPVLEVRAPTAGETPKSRAIARAVDAELRDGLRRFSLVNLLSAGAVGANTGEAHVDYRLDTSIVRTLEGPADVTLVLNRVADQRAIWSMQIPVEGAARADMNALAPAIAQIGGDYGVIVRDQVERQPDSFATGYPCLAQFNRMRQMRTMQYAQQVGACLRASLKIQPRDSILLSALSWLRFGDWQPLRGTDAGKTAFAEARALAVRAYEAGPNTAAGQFAMARAHFYGGDCIAGNAMGEGALRLNGYDPDITGFIGLFKAACGDNAAALPLLKRSVELDSTYAGVPAVTLAFMLSQTGEQGQALAILDRMPSPSNLEPQYLMTRAIVLARQGDAKGARALWTRLLVYTRQPATAPPEQVLRQFMITPAVIKRSAEALRDSGVAPPPAGR